ncbi:Hypothetical protein, putative [Bodo saltans]|uniref:Complex 1 LYR protein domain-containing protein n=1 Tax=Bodo saltans TaxID=75058 RepID=A0A0S4JNM0_BODSA|nr:Hypothetical protein, putative [Bodo saltans]|eukprot:CUG91845.1 Hypothetical protein, putative [Bodo saltans]
MRLAPLSSASYVRAHSHHFEGENGEDHAFQSQQRVAGINADTIAALPTVALSSTPPKQGRHQTGRKRLSGIQQEVLVLYRNLLRETRKFEDAASRHNITTRIRDEFKEDAAIPRKLLAKIEWKLHYGRNKLEDIKSMRPNSRFRVMS